MEDAMVKAIIQIRGYNQKKSSKLQKSIIKFMKKTKIGSAIACEIVESAILSCDGKNSPGAYLKIVTSKRKYATAIIEEFTKNKILETVVISLDNMLLGPEDMASGK